MRSYRMRGILFVPWTSVQKYWTHGPRPDTSINGKALSKLSQFWCDSLVGMGSVQWTIVNCQIGNGRLDQSSVCSLRSWFSSFCPPSTMSATPHPPSANAAATKANKVPLPPLELTAAEMAVIEKWTSAYEKTIGSKDRLKMLSTQILPRLTPLNTHMSEDAWRVRKSVSRWHKLLKKHI